MLDHRRRTSLGPGVDAAGRPVVDPSRNVLDKVDSEVRRIDDLREQAENHVREMMELRDVHFERLRVAEAARIDAIRGVDQGTVAATAVVQATQVSTVAATLATTAEAMRSQVAATATANALALRSETDPLRKDIADLRQVQYETAGGKQQTATELTTSTARSGSWGLWVGIAVAVVLGGISSFVGFIGLVVAVYVALGR